MRRSPHDNGRNLRLLLDSHTLLWAIYSPDRLSNRVSLLLQDEANELVVSHATLWELLNKIGRGKLLLAGTSVNDVVERVMALGVTLFPIELNHMLLSSSLPHHHSDPFDRMIIAQAMEENLPVLTSDAQFSAYDIEIIWQ